MPADRPKCSCAPGGCALRSPFSTGQTYPPGRACRHPSEHGDQIPTANQATDHDVLRAALSRIVKLPAAGFDKGQASAASRIAREALAAAPEAAHHPRRDDDVAQWLTRMRDAWSQDGEGSESRAIDSLLARYRECAELGLTLAAEHDEAGKL